MSGDIHVFAVSDERQMWHRASVQGIWQPWEEVGYPECNSAPSAVQRSFDRIDVAVIGKDGNLYWITWNDKNFLKNFIKIEAKNDKGEIVARPSFTGDSKISAIKGDDVRVYAVGINNTIYESKMSNETWAPYSSVDTKVAATIFTSLNTLTSNIGTEKQNWLFWTGTDTSVYQRTLGGSGWQSTELTSSISGAKSAVAGASQGNYSLDLFVIFGQNADLSWLHGKEVNNALQWDSSWKLVITGPCARKPTVVSAGNGVLDVFVRMADGKVAHK